MGLAVIGVLILFTTQFLRVKLMNPSLETLRSKPDDANSLARWRTGAIASCIMAESVVLLGFALRFTGGTLKQALPFYAMGIGLMILWWPQRP